VSVTIGLIDSSQSDVDRKYKKKTKSSACQAHLELFTTEIIALKCR